MDDARLDLLVRDCWPRLVRTAYLLTGDVPAAEELVRDALRRRLAQERTAAGLRDAVVREAFRHRALHTAGSAPFNDAGDGAERVRAVLRRLPLDERTVLVLRFHEGLTVDQVVDVLRVPADVVRERETRALRAMADAGLPEQDGAPRPDELKPLLAAVVNGFPPLAPPDLRMLVDAPARGRWWRRR